MQTIPLTNSDQVALVDDQDYAYLSQWQWRLHSMGYACREDYSTGKHVTIFIHNVLMNNQKLIDHKDLNKLNNQRDNLRLADLTFNNANKHVNACKTIFTTSQYKGVDKHSSGKWRATIKFRYKKIHLGLFTNEVDAAKAYNAKAIELFGEFARVNEL